jgi:tetratricopeptide (TPR) repeat protein
LKIIVYILLFTASVFKGFTQYNPGSVNKKAENLYNNALHKAGEGEFREGIKMLQQAVKIDPNYLDAYLSIGGIYGELKEYKNAVDNYEKARSIDSVYFKDFALSYSINLAGLGEFQEALNAVNEFLSISDLNPTGRKAGEYRKHCYNFAIEYANKKSVADYKFEPKNLGDSINSKVSEYFPTITIDGRQLFYTRRVNNMNEDFYESSMVDNSWKPAKSLEGDINTTLNEGAQNISQDGEWLIFTDVIFRKDMEAVTCTFLISLHRGGVRRKILETISIRNHGNQHPACHQINAICILPVTVRKEWARVIFMYVTVILTEAGVHL